MTQTQDVAALQACVAELEQQLDRAKGVVSTLYHALDDASTVVDAGDDEDFAYQAELEAGAGLLGIDRASVQRATAKLNVEVVATGTASDAEDESVPGVYGHQVTLSRSLQPLALMPAEAGAIAEAVLDVFHERQGIECLEDFTITVRIKDGPVIVEMDDITQHDLGLVKDVKHLNKVSALGARSLEPTS